MRHKQQSCSLFFHMSSLAARAMAITVALMMVLTQSAQTQSPLPVAGQCRCALRTLANMRAPFLD